MQAADHVPRGTTAAFADLQTSLRKPDHHVIGRQVINTFSAVPLACDFMDLPGSATSFVWWPELDGNAVAICSLVGIDVTEFPWW
eukprot:CAMPEP_0197671396 /NCGR_PEP_ID=MMETSP1338-20131121/76621_1 /TAXON_ID=43686 ORGANISM="Pelagodinium beii, Strain RCC1491" /NCGR_SAMPLE_ID=MMETSP1338 /ASSEMBLY_ACC=CAM_ASM_000754 /LENGTH=84 /DNA_ID=CAMNT_0043251283 /DNA_START=212 /DNA_END=463 /DNA_ORIENTATION=-